MKKKIWCYIAILFVVLAIAFIIYLNIKTPSIGEYYIVEFNENKKIEEEDYNALCNILNKNFEMENIEIHKIAYEVEFRHESSFYIFFKINNSQYNTKFERYNQTYTICYKDDSVTEIAMHHICLNTGFDEEYRKVRKICMKYYRLYDKFWEINEKHIKFSRD